MIEIIDHGLLATLQGRPYRGSRHIGMPLAGAADLITMAVANKLASNKFDAPSIEFSLVGPTIKAHKNCIIGIAGPIKSATVNGSNCDHFSSIALRSGDILKTRASGKGAHIYIAVHGGFHADHHWDGNSTFLPANIGGHHGQALRSNSFIEHDDLQDTALLTLPERYRLSYSDQHVMRICADNDKIADKLTQSSWSIGRQASRIGYELIHKENAILIDTASSDRLSRAVFPGTIQCPPSGNPFLLGVDTQTTGGYPIIGHVIRADRHILGQIKSGDILSFITNKPHEARRVYQQKLNMWREYIPDLRLD